MVRPQALYHAATAPQHATHLLLLQLTQLRKRSCHGAVVGVHETHSIGLDGYKKHALLQEGRAIESYVCSRPTPASGFAAPAGKGRFPCPCRELGGGLFLDTNI
jgi:hypothetical protein